MDRHRDRTTLALCAVFVPVAGFYLLTAATGVPPGVHEPRANPYNLLANALLHLHLSVGRAPAQLLSLSEPYNPARNAPILSHIHPSIDDYVLYHGHLFLTWGPVPAVVLAFVHLAGVEPSSSTTVLAFAIVGFAFALAVLRIVLRQLGDPPAWMCVAAASTLGLASSVPFILRNGGVYEEALASGFCFVMAGVWLAMSTLARRTATRRRLLLMSLCFGLAAGSRPTLALTAIVLAPVYLSLRTSHARRDLLATLAIPLAICLLLLIGYNQVRFGSPLEVGVRYQLTGYDSLTAHFGDPAYIPQGAWAYLLAPPRADILFPFLALAQPPLSYPLSLPSRLHLVAEPTGGLLPMAPILIFLAALPWIWLRRRDTPLGPCVAPLSLLAGAGVAILIFLSYEFFGTTERYEVDFATLLLLAALANWLLLCSKSHGIRRRFLQTTGALLVAWTCFTGAAASVVGYTDPLFNDNSGAWSKLEAAGSPVSRAMAAIVGHPILANLSAPDLTERFHIDYTTLGVGDTTFRLSTGAYARITVVSPNRRVIAVVADIQIVSALRDRYGLETTSASGSDYSRLLSGIGGQVQVPVQVNAGVNHLALLPVASAPIDGKATSPGRLVLRVKRLSLANA